jgi:hypothetical protein
MGSIPHSGAQFFVWYVSPGKTKRAVGGFSPGTPAFFHP